MKKLICSLFILLLFVNSAIAADNFNLLTHNFSRNSIINILTIDNFHKVDNNYYRGSQPDNYDIVLLKKLGIKTIINLRNEKPDVLSSEKIASLNNNINYVNISMRADKPPTEEQIRQFFTVINNSNNLPVYVHCLQGKDRTGVMTGLYRLKKYGWAYSKIYAEMKKHGYHSILFPRQKRFLARYIKAYNS